MSCPDLLEQFEAQFIFDQKRQYLGFDDLLVHAKQWVGKPKLRISSAKRKELHDIYKRRKLEFWEETLRRYQVEKDQTYPLNIMRETIEKNVDGMGVSHLTITPDVWLMIYRAAIDSEVSGKQVDVINAVSSVLNSIIKQDGE